MRKIILVTLGVLLLSGCVQTTALLGPAVIGGSSGSIYKASLHYGTSYIIKESTGKTASEHAFGLLQEPIKKMRKEKKIRNELTNHLEQHILTARANNLFKKNIFSTRKKLLGNN